MADSVSEADLSGEGTGTGTGMGMCSKASELKKKERIRDNQRRSRARRHEHLTDLENRVVASHAACRDAEMQREAFRDAQIENTRLRELLRVAGVNDAIVQSYVNQGISQSQSGDPTQRMLRPRMETGQEGRRGSGEGRAERARTSPYPDVSGMRRLNVEADSSFSRLLATSLPERRSPMVSQVLPMTPHILHDAHLQQINMFQPASPHRDDDSCWDGFELPSNAAWQA